MAILSDFFAASPNQITSEVLQGGPTRVFPTISATSFTTLELAPLLQIVREGSLDDAAVIAAADEFEDVPGGGPPAGHQCHVCPSARRWRKVRIVLRCGGAVVAQAGPHEHRTVHSRVGCR